MQPRSDYYDMPPDKWISFKYCDLTKLIKIRFSRQIKKRYANFDAAVRLGETAPEVDLRGDDGRRYRLSERVGKKYVVMSFGAIT